MIEIIKETVLMPELSERRYQKSMISVNKWIVTDTSNNKIVYKGCLENVAIACHNLNKKHYRK